MWTAPIGSLPPAWSRVDLDAVQSLHPYPISDQQVRPALALQHATGNKGAPPPDPISDRTLRSRPFKLFWLSWRTVGGI
jgi:hypothetical protein